MTANPSDQNNVITCLGGDRTALQQWPVPEPGKGEILLRLRVVGLCGTDLFKLDTGTEKAGGVLGHELVGEVVGLGPGVTKFRHGERIVVPHHVPCGECVYCRRGSETMCEAFKENLLEPGGFADTILVRARAVEQAAHRVPDSISDEAAVFLEPAACVLRGIHRSALPEDGAAVILGAGSMGLLHLLVLKATSPGVPVTVIDPVAERRAMAETLGAIKTAGPGPEALEAVREMTRGNGDAGGADVVFDTVGGGKTLADGINMTRQGGAVVMFAHAPGNEAAEVDLNAVFKYERRIIGTYSGALREQNEIFRLLGSGALDPAPLVTHTMPLDDFEQGVALVRNQQALKVLFTPSRAASEG